MKIKTLRLRGISNEDNLILNIISNNMGITKCELLRSKIREIVNNYPKDLREGKKDLTFKDGIVISGISETLMDELECISHNFGVSISQLIRPEIHSIIDSYPLILKSKQD
jgi:hypothetical protein